jgi:hypothetical protein
MFSDGQLRRWATKYLKGGAWYLDCVATWTHLEEEELQRSLEVLGEGGPHLSKLLEIDEFVSLDEEAREKAIAKWDAVDKRKVDKVAKQVQDATLKVSKKLERAIEKALGKSGGNKKEAEGIFFHGGARVCSNRSYPESQCGVSIFSSHRECHSTMARLHTIY